MPMINLSRADKREETATHRAVRKMFSSVGAVGAFSCLISILMLTYPLYMMQLFDRVLASMSVETLVMLTIITIAAIVTLGALEAIRSRVMVRLSVGFDDAIGSKTFDALMRANLKRRVGGMTLNQIDQIRAFLTGPGLVAFFDLPFVPLFLLVLFLLHPALGTVAVVCGTGVVLLGLSIEWLCRSRLKASATEANRAAMFADNSMRNAEVVAALGMIGNLRQRWLKDHDAAIDAHAGVVDTMAIITGAMKAASMLMPILMLATACYLVILEQTTPGAMFAASVLGARVIAPIQQAVTGYRGFTATREAYRNLDDLLSSVPDEKDRVKLPKPAGWLNVDKVTAGPPGAQVPILKVISFKLQPGDILGVIGPSGAGKSTLARLLVGVWPAYAGNIRLDASDVHAWDYDSLGPHIGYLPQDIELFDGSVADNICRFGERDDDKVIAAARKVGLHNTILRLSDGYDTEITGSGGVLSGGQRQRLGLARALYDDPSLVVLDEPNSNLDGNGELALLDALKVLREDGKTVVIIAHNPRVLQVATKVAVLEDGRLTQFGPKDKVMSKMRVITSQSGKDAPDTADGADNVQPMVADRDA